MATYLGGGGDWEATQNLKLANLQSTANNLANRRLCNFRGRRKLWLAGLTCKCIGAKLSSSSWRKGKTNLQHEAFMARSVLSMPLIQFVVDQRTQTQLYCLSLRLSDWEGLFYRA